MALLNIENSPFMLDAACQPFIRLGVPTNVKDYQVLIFNLTWLREFDLA